ncbi:uncharacterized protein LOC117652646 isoform X2 [Thrips palmi]|nr:uncharacterized protein LOC117652646 isoform X2 [Thrips palmi]
MLDSDSDSDDGILRPNGYVDVDVDLVDISFGGRDSGGPPPAKKTRRGKKGRAAARQSLDDTDTPSPFADSSATFEDSPSFTIPDDPEPSPCPDDSIVIQEERDEVSLEDICDKVRRQHDRKIAQTSKRATRTSRRAAARGGRPVELDNEESIVICPEDSPEDVFDLSLNQSSFCSDVDDSTAQSEEHNVEVSIRVVWKGSNTKKFSLRKYQKIKEIYTYYANLEGVDEGRILFTLRDKPVTPNDTPMTLNIGVSSLEGGVIDEADVPSHGAQNADSEAQEDPNALRLQVQRKGMRDKHTVYVYPHEKISVLISKLSEDLKIPVSSFKLKFDGDFLSPDSTPNDHDMEGDECIDLIE